VTGGVVADAGDMADMVFVDAGSAAALSEGRQVECPTARARPSASLRSAVRRCIDGLVTFARDWDHLGPNSVNL
jgi:hypothetical protein